MNTELEAQNASPADQVVGENVETVETPEAVAESSTTPEPETGEVDAEGKPKKNRVSGAERIKQLTGEKYAEKARADEAIAKLKDAEAKLARYQPKKAPTIDEFSSDADYETARIRHEVAEKRRVEAEFDIEEARGNVQTAVEAAWSVRVDAFKKNAPDFDTAVAVIGKAITTAKAALIKESELGPEVAYHLATNPEEAQKFIYADPLAAARQLGRIEAQLSIKPGRKISNAPPPVDTVNGALSGNSGSPELMSTAQLRSHLGIGSK